VTDGASGLLEDTGPISVSITYVIAKYDHE